MYQIKSMCYNKGPNIGLGSGNVFLLEVLVSILSSVNLSRLI